MHEIPLGKAVDYPQDYAPEVLFPIARAESRSWPHDSTNLPFRGEDIWNSWELSWLDATGKPVAGTATIRIPADSGNLIESKSLKLYINSLANSRHNSAQDLQGILARDLSVAATGKVSVNVVAASESTCAEVGEFSGICIDDIQIGALATEPDPGLLNANPEEVVSEELYSHILRSNCPITNQPDTGSILVRYEGASMDRRGLLEYFISYRNHNAFHEACVEQIFLDIKARCAPLKLTIYARYNRRGGLDINPFRSDFEDAPDNLRLWRQ